MQVVRKAVHQDDDRFLARILSGVNAVLISAYKVLNEIHFAPIALLRSNSISSFAPFNHHFVRDFGSSSVLPS